MAGNLLEIGDGDYLIDLVKSTYGLRLYINRGYFTNSIYVSETNIKGCRVREYSCSITEEQFLANIMKDFLFS
jgi:hypothetical protein